MRRFAALCSICLASVMALGFSALAESTDGVDMIGSWKFDFLYGGSQMASEIVVLNDDGTFLSPDSEDDVEETWKLDGETLVLASDGENVELVWNEDDLAFEGTYEGLDLSMTKIDEDGISIDDGSEEKTLVGGWSVSEDSEITDDLENVFQMAIDDYQKDEETITVAYEPVAYLGSQVVAGVNRAFLARESEIDEGTKWVIVKVYEDLDGNASVLEKTDLEW